MLLSITLLFLSSTTIIINSLLYCHHSHPAILVSIIVGSNQPTINHDRAMANRRSVPLFLFVPTLHWPSPVCTATKRRQFIITSTFHIWTANISCRARVRRLMSAQWTQSVGSLWQAGHNAGLGAPNSSGPKAGPPARLESQFQPIQDPRASPLPLAAWRTNPTPATAWLGFSSHSRRHN